MMISVLGKITRIPIVPVGTTGIIPNSMHKEGYAFPEASCDSKKDAGD
jgi:hypothetical protein